MRVDGATRNENALRAMAIFDLPLDFLVRQRELLVFSHRHRGHVIREGLVLVLLSLRLLVAHLLLLLQVARCHSCRVLLIGIVGSVVHEIRLGLIINTVVHARLVIVCSLRLIWLVLILI